MTWRERIVQARERGAFTSEDIHMADSWTTCAVGEQQAAMPLVIKSSFSRHDRGPKDFVLYQLGVYESFMGETGFTYAVHMHDIDRAEALLDQIEDRALQLKREWEEGVEHDV